MLGRSLLLRFQSLPAIFEYFYPHHEWKRELFDSSQKRSSQWSVSTFFENMFGNEEILHEDYQIQTDSRQIELDIFLPNLAFAIEYNGRQLYYNSDIFGMASQYSERDDCKWKECNKVKKGKIPSQL